MVGKSLTFHNLVHELTRNYPGFNQDLREDLREDPELDKILDTFKLESQALHTLCHVLSILEGLPD